MSLLGNYWQIYDMTDMQLPDFELPQEAFEETQSLERHQRMNFPSRLGVDIFGETSEEFVKQKAAEWVQAQKAEQVNGH